MDVPWLKLLPAEHVVLTGRREERRRSIHHTVIVVVVFGESGDLGAPSEGTNCATNFLDQAPVDDEITRTS